MTSKTDREASFAVIRGDFDELLKPLWQAACQAMGLDEATRVRLTFSAELRLNSTTGDYWITCSAKSAGARQEIEHKARIDDQQFVLIE